MKSPFPPLPACLLLCAPCCALAATTLDFDQQIHTVIPDNDDRGITSFIDVSGTDLTIIAVDIFVATQNGWNGDMYAYVEHNGILSVLLNRPGRTSAAAGAASSGMQFHFADAAPADIHTAISTTPGALATGTYQPDARAADPAVVTDASPRSLFLSDFTGQDAAGKWTLFVADLAGGEVATLGNWSLSVTVVPEPSTALLLLLGAAGTLLIRSREPHAANTARPRGGRGQDWHDK